MLVLDEPAVLDPRGSVRIIQLFNSINRELGITLIFATHGVDIVPLLADRVYMVNRGKIVLAGTTAEVFAQKDSIREDDLRLPRVLHLAELLGRNGKYRFPALPLSMGQAKNAFWEPADIRPS